MGVQEAASHAFTGSVTTENPVYLNNASDTLNIQLISSKYYDEGDNVRMNDMLMVYDDAGNPILQSEDVRFNIKKSNDTVIRISVRKEANGPSFDEARNTAEKIDYEYILNGNTLRLNNFLTTAKKSAFNNQEVRVNLYLPAGTVIQYDLSSERLWTIRADTDTSSDNFENYLWKMGPDGELKCQECPDQEMDNDDDNHIRINEDGIDININDKNGESFEMKIDEGGVRIKANDNDEERVDIDIASEGNSIKITAEDGDTTMTKTIVKD